MFFFKSKKKKKQEQLELLLKTFDESDIFEPLTDIFKEFCVATSKEGLFFLLLGKPNFWSPLEVCITIAHAYIYNQDFDKYTTENKLDIEGALLVSIYDNLVDHSSLDINKTDSKNRIREKIGLELIK